MDKETLIKARDDTAARFSDIQNELARLQGDYRTYEKLIQQLDEAAAKKEVKHAENPAK